MKIDEYDVYDTVKPVLLHIKSADAASGQKDPSTCAAAKAACRLPGVLEARIYRTRSYLLHKTKSGKKVWHRYITPAALRSEIISFDRGAYFDPGNYRLVPVGESNKLGTLFTRKKKVGSSGVTKPRSKPHVVKGIREHGPRGGRNKQ